MSTVKMLLEMLELSPIINLILKTKLQLSASHLLFFTKFKILAVFQDFYVMKV